MSAEVVCCQIDGREVTSTEAFDRVVGEAVNGPGGYFGQNLDSFSDCLHGGIGTPDDGNFCFVWTHSGQSRAALGYPEGVRQLQQRLQRCHPANQDSIRAGTSLPRRGPNRLR